MKKWIATLALMLPLQSQALDPRVGSDIYAGYWWGITEYQKVCYRAEYEAGSKRKAKEMVDAYFADWNRNKAADSAIEVVVDHELTTTLRDKSGKQTCTIVLNAPKNDKKAFCWIPACY